MRKILAIAAAALLGFAAAPAPAFAQATIEKLYVLDCGQGRASDMSRWTPGLNLGVAMDVRDNCYLIKHSKGWLMWDTGIAERVAELPDGQPGPTVWKRPITIAAQLQQIGIAPADIKWVAVSHTHADHVGNVDMFPAAELLIQQAEWDFAVAPGKTPVFKPERAVPVRKLAGDLDVFGDGSVRLVSTPGHTPGHQVAVVRMKATGYVLLSGDAVHFKDNWENRRVPSMNTDKEQTLASLDRIAGLMKELSAQLWINHDKAQGDAAKRPPAFYD